MITGGYIYIRLVNRIFGYGISFLIDNGVKLYKWLEKN